MTPKDVLHLRKCFGSQGFCSTSFAPSFKLVLGDVYPVWSAAFVGILFGSMAVFTIELWGREAPMRENHRQRIQKSSFECIHSMCVDLASVCCSRLTGKLLHCLLRPGSRLVGLTATLLREGDKVIVHEHPRKEPTAF
eukprot:3978702-Amphidinium_carterae.1